MSKAESATRRSVTADCESKVAFSSSTAARFPPIKLKGSFGDISAAIAARSHFILSLLCGEQKRHNPINVKFWEVIADNLSKAGWSWGCVATVDSNGQTIFVANAHRDNGKRLIVTADGKLRAFLELQRVTRESFRSPNAE